MISLLWVCLEIAGLLLINLTFVNALSGSNDSLVQSSTTIAPSSTAPVTFTGALFNSSNDGPCQNYTVLRESWRNVNTPRVSPYCDRNLLRPGVWYRMMPPAGNAIPEITPPTYSCGADAPMWLNGTHPTSVSGSPVVRQLCANWAGNPCLWSTVVQVALCSGGYYVYMAPVSVVPTCSLTWCGVNALSGSNDSLVQSSTTSVPLSTDPVSFTRASLNSSNGVNAFSGSNDSLVQSSTTSVPSSTAPVTFTSALFNSSNDGPCQNYTVLRESWRNVNTPRVSPYCDRNLLRPGVWYRMMPPAGNAIPEITPPIYSCGTDAPMWLNGTHPTSVSGTPVVRQLCANWNGNPCLWSTVVQVALCSGGYYVYMAPVSVTPACSLTWCGVMAISHSNDSYVKASTTRVHVATDRWLLQVLYFTAAVVVARLSR